MQSRRTRYGYTLRLDPGEEVAASLTEFAAREGVRAGAVSGLGAVGPVELGFFVRETASYVRHVFEGEHEILSLTGNNYLPIFLVCGSAYLAAFLIIQSLMPRLEPAPIDDEPQQRGFEVVQ